jgi:hypothetical protein
MARGISRRDFVKLAALATGGAGLAAHELRNHFASSGETSGESSPPIDIEQFRESDVVLLFTPGGWGQTPLAEDPDWQEIFEKIQEELGARGYRAIIAEERRERGALSFLTPGPAARKIDYLLTSLPNLKIIIGGRSTATVFIEGILHTLPSTDRLLAIEASRPFEKRSALVAPERTLIIPNPEYDPLEEGDLGGIVRQSSARVFWGNGGDFGLGPLRVDFTLPPHHTCCPWNPQTKELVKTFLDCHFPAKMVK